MRIRSRNTRLCILLCSAVCALFVYRFGADEWLGPAAPQTTTFNRTWWDAKSLPKIHQFYDCGDDNVATKNTSLTESLQQMLRKPINGPPLSKYELCSMTEMEVELYYQRYFGMIQTLCKRTVRMGNSNDGGWDICADDLTPGQRNCLVYSFGIQFDFTFDDDIADIYGCEVHSFDPSMHREDHLHKPSVYFHATGLSDYSGISRDMAGWKMRTFQALREDLQHSDRVLEVVKMDIEGWEWNVLPNMLATSQLENVHQLLVELHTYPDYDTVGSVKGYWIHKLLIVGDLYKAGYRIFWIGRNTQCKYTSPILKKTYYSCLEISFIKVRDPA